MLIEAYETGPCRFTAWPGSTLRPASKDECARESVREMDQPEACQSVRATFSSLRLARTGVEQDPDPDGDKPSPRDEF